MTDAEPCRCTVFGPGVITASAACQDERCAVALSKTFQDNMLGRVWVMEKRRIHSF